MSHEEKINYLKTQSKSIEITLNQYVEAYYGKKILPYDYTAKEDIIKVVERSLNIIKNNEFTFKNGSNVYEGRINEFGNAMEDVFCQAFYDITGERPVNLGTGYPDAHVLYKGKHFYFEFKIQANLEVKNGLRIFYTSPPSERTKKSKNLQDGFHILVSFEHKGAGKLTGRTAIKDLNNLSYKHQIVQQCGPDKLLELNSIL